VIEALVDGEGVIVTLAVGEADAVGVVVGVAVAVLCMLRASICPFDGADCVLPNCFS
jgi:hypothetical protein